MNNYKKYADQLSHIGDDPNLPDYIREKLWITNLAVFLGILFSFFYICRSLVLSQLSSIVFLSLTVFVTFCFLLLTNIYGGIVYSRYLVVMIPVIANAIIIILSSTADLAGNETLIFGSLCYALFSFIIIDFKEKKFLIFTLVSCMSIILATPILSTFVSNELKISIKSIDSLEKIQMFINFFLLGIIATYLIRDFEIKKQAVLSKKAKMAHDINVIRQSIIYKNLLLADRFSKLKTNIRYKDVLGDIQQIRQIIMKNDHAGGVKKMISLFYTRLSFINMAYHRVYVDENKMQKAELSVSYNKNIEQKYIIKSTTNNKDNLIGQVIRSQKYIYIPNLPRNYSYRDRNSINQVSDLEVERHLYIYPIVYDTNLLGILEFTCQRALSESKFEYLEIASKTAGQEMFLNNKG